MITSMHKTDKSVNVIIASGNWMWFVGLKQFFFLLSVAVTVDLLDYVACGYWCILSFSSVTVAVDMFSS